MQRFNTVVVDAGHGGHDSGAVSRRPPQRTIKKKRGRKVRIVSVGPSAPYIRAVEKDLALDTARRLKSKLEASGLRVVMTRDSDRFIPLDERVAISNRQRNSFFVSVHYNDSPKRTIYGTEVYRNRFTSEEFSQRILRSVAGVPGVSGRFTKEAQFRVLRNSTGPAVLVECGYLSHQGEVARCVRPEYRDQIAEAIARAIMEQRALPR